MKNSEKIQCIIFDCDNVLVDTETTFISVIMDMAGILGAEIDADEAITLFSGKKITDTIAILQKRSIKAFPDDFEQSFRKKVYEEFRQGVAAVDGAEELLKSLELSFCVTSSGPREKIDLNLKLTKLDRFFTDDTIFSCYDIDSWKPEPAIFLRAASKMGFKPEQCVVIEDSIAGIQAATAGGFRVYGRTNGFNKLELQENGAITFDYLSELPELLKLKKRYTNTIK